MISLSHGWLLLTFIILGVVQGITEPIPVSSSGHVILIKHLFGIHTDGLSFEIIVHFGSLIAIIIMYRKDIRTLLHNTYTFVKTREQTYYQSFLFTLYLLIATAITGLIGLSVENWISDELTKPIYIGICLLVTGIFIWVIRNLRGNKAEKDITLLDVVIIGLAQSFALIPGISRSGATVVAAMLLGMKRKTALRFSFLLFIPVSIGTSVLSIPSIWHDTHFNQLFIPYTVAFIASLIATYIALRWFIKVMLSGKLHIFVYYCFLLGIGIIILHFFHLL